jgi:putative transposase
MSIPSATAREVAAPSSWLDRIASAAATDGHARLRWQADHPGALWQVDVCHGPTLRVAAGTLPIRVHAIIDDASRYIVALEAHATERERDMLGLLADAIRRHGPPDVLYLDNGSTYSGDALRLACERLGVTLVHSKPYQPQGRGQIERFFRTLRARCLDYVGDCQSLHAVNVRLMAFLDQHYHHAAHAGLMGRTPDAVWRERAVEHRPVNLVALENAFTARMPRRIRRDSTLDIGGTTYELRQGFLAGKVVEVARTLIDDGAAWVEHDEKRYELHPVDLKANSARRRQQKPTPRPAIPFDPATSRVDAALSRNRRKTEDKPR